MIDTEKKLKEEIEALEARIDRLEEEFLRRRKLFNQLELESLSRCACGCKDKEVGENIRGSQPEKKEKKLFQVRLYYQKPNAVKECHLEGELVREVGGAAWEEVAERADDAFITEGPYGAYFCTAVWASDEDDALIEGYCKIENWFEGVLVAHEKAWDEREDKE